MRRCWRHVSASTRIRLIRISSSTGIRKTRMYGSLAEDRATDSSMVPRSERWWQISCSKTEQRMPRSGSRDSNMAPKCHLERMTYAPEFAMHEVFRFAQDDNPE